MSSNSVEFVMFKMVDTLRWTCGDRRRQAKFAMMMWPSSPHDSTDLATMSNIKNKCTREQDRRGRIDGSMGSSRVIAVESNQNILHSLRYVAFVQQQHHIFRYTRIRSKQNFVTWRTINSAWRVIEKGLRGKTHATEPRNSWSPKMMNQSNSASNNKFSWMATNCRAIDCLLAVVRRR